MSRTICIVESSALEREYATVMLMATVTKISNISRIGFFPNLKVDSETHINKR